MVEGDATMSSYVDAEGKARQSLSIRQRMLNPLPSFPLPGWCGDTDNFAGALDVLRRPYNPAAEDEQAGQQ